MNGLQAGIGRRYAAGLTFQIEYQFSRPWAYMSLGPGRPIRKTSPMIAGTWTESAGIGL